MRVMPEQDGGAAKAEEKKRERESERRKGQGEEGHQIEKDAVPSKICGLCDKQKPVRGLRPKHGSAPPT